jgi:ribonuclease HI
MTSNNKPETLTELLHTLEHSDDLRSLARECGLSVRELRRRLAIWRREMISEDAGEMASSAPEIVVAAGKNTGKKSSAKAKPESKHQTFPELISAKDIKRNPLPKHGSDVLEIFTDGASRGNPGPASVGVYFRQKGGAGLAEYCETIGMTTNNVAEYRAVVAALEICRDWKAKKVHLFMDSELIVRQIHGTFRVKSPDLRPLYQQVQFLIKELKEFKVTHIKRAQNSHADALTNKALDQE